MSIYKVLEQLNPSFLQGTSLSEEKITKFREDRFTIADYDTDVFLSIFPEFLKVFERETNKFNFMFATYCDIAQHLFSEEEYDRSQVLCISLYIAHNLELALNRTKNIDNNISLNSANIQTTLSNDKGGKDKTKHLASFESYYRQTDYGMMLYPLMKTVGRTRKWGVF